MVMISAVLFLVVVVVSLVVVNVVLPWLILFYVKYPVKCLRALCVIRKQKM